MGHLSAIRLRLSHERTRLQSASSDAEREYRSVLVAQIEREERDELKFLGIAETPTTLTDDELLAELMP